MIEHESFTSESKWRAAEFFAGIGLAGIGLEKADIKVAWSNDISPVKYALYEKHFGEREGHRYIVGDLATLEASQDPIDIDVAWASFPCTDLSVAGTRAGIHRGTSSSAFWYFVKTLSRMKESRPSVVVLENVNALATRRGGEDIASVIRALNGLGYSVDVMSIDAKHFVAQSRPRLFLVGAKNVVVEGGSGSSLLRPPWLNAIFEDDSLVTHRGALPTLPSTDKIGLASHIDRLDDDYSRWWNEGRVAAYLSSLSEIQRERLDALISANVPAVRTAYRRMRSGEPRWEMRNDDIAGCLRTSRGGSSKQALIVVNAHGRLQIRWMTPKEYASLMGVPEYDIEGVKPHHAYSGFGDAVRTPVVEWLSKNYIVPILESIQQDRIATAC
ncbi:DNA (cytosine-5-)-methyltransferase OS=Tsukamurella paurometabola (strain ATCC 8368 / DSM /CCUG 35730 / CIP 100753 / JCM 10117 / KCTC 9821 / NBRC 16120/ NCIMB 702349 / NCTC 13040) OX=521096 GN=Tpau_1588 PE=3 SV=1 [Tsukamurella paurometabola]